MTSFMTLGASPPFPGEAIDDWDSLLLDVRVPGDMDDMLLTSGSLDSSSDAVDLICFADNLGPQLSTELSEASSRPPPRSPAPISFSAATKTDESDGLVPCIAAHGLDALVPTSPFATAPPTVVATPPALHATAVPLPLGPHGLRLQLDPGSVMAAWSAAGGGAAPHPFGMRGLALSAAAATIPSAAVLRSSLSVGAQQQEQQQHFSFVPTQALASRPQRQALTPAAAPAPRAPGQPAPRKRRPVVPGLRKLSSDKRPRIKGRFVTRHEYDAAYEAALAASSAKDRAVPAA